MKSNRAQDEVQGGAVKGAEFEYKIGDNPCAVMVRPKREKRGRPNCWSLYMECNSPEDAERILFLLQHPEAEGVVTP